MIGSPASMVPASLRDLNRAAGNANHWHY